MNQPILDLQLPQEIGNKYKSNSQKIRVMTEAWVRTKILCPACGHHIENYPNNQPVADFFCVNCNEDFELKSKNGYFGGKVVNGAYSSLISRLQSNKNPNLFLLAYSKSNYLITSFIVIPKQFFIAEIIEKRPPLSQSAKRAGWIGCNIEVNKYLS